MASTNSKDVINIVVLGAGVIGLTSAMILSQDERFNVTVVAKHMPGDYDIEYASPWAGANFLPAGQEGTLLQKLESDTWNHLERLAREVPEAAIHFQDTYSFSKKSHLEGAMGKWAQATESWFSKTTKFRTLEKHELPTGWDSGTACLSVCINTALYLPWLVSQCLKNGVVFKRGIAANVTDAVVLHASGKKADLVVNATGLGSLKLGGVLDTDVYPARGQTVLVRNDPGMMAYTSGTDDGAEEATYIMQRAAGGGTILGGCLQKNVWESQPDPNLAVRIMKRCIEICPALSGGKGIEGLSVIKHNVGLRPMREGGPRVEKDVVDGVKIVHAYGHGGYGYQSSYGTANLVVELVNRHI